MAATAPRGSRQSRRLARGLGPTLVRWFEAHRRPLPWQRDRDPYHIWVAEVLLQQTRVDQAAPSYVRFVRRFPSVRALAAAPLGTVLKLWQGAGYCAGRVTSTAPLAGSPRTMEGRSPSR